MITKKIVLLIIKFYQFFLSADTGLFKPILLSVFGNGSNRICRHYPTCSQYTYESVEKYGVIKGLVLGFSKIWNCRN